MRGRDTAEEGRTATPLELLYDLCYVVAIAQIGLQLEHAVAEHHYATAVTGFGFAFFAVWWAWMNFTWFASAYDTDDVPYRLGRLVQITGVLVIASGVPRAFEDLDFTVPILGYAIIRIVAIAEWLRAGVQTRDPGQRTAAFRYARGIAFAQAGWIAWLFLPDAWRTGWAVAFIVVELLVPPYAERHARTPWHAHHISERYGLFTIIVLGESITAATVGIQQAVDGKAEA
ncbi:low temperature requirement protein A, partial [Streptomyces sp. SB3404]|nr:low temperature requirement protein A [Streptomyces boncukensis]